MQNSRRFLLGVDLPLDGHIPALGDAQGLENAHGGDFGGGVFAHDLADHQLQRQAVLALLLLGHVAQQAADGERIAGLLALAQAQLEFQHAAIGGVVAQRGAVDRLAIERAAKERGDFGAAAGAEQLIEGFEVEQRGVVVAEAALPGRIGVEKRARRAERGDHLARVLEQIAIALLRFAQRLLLAQGGALIHGHGHQAARARRRRRAARRRGG